jgi:hypothetical protein
VTPAPKKNDAQIKEVLDRERGEAEAGKAEADAKGGA